MTENEKLQCLFAIWRDKDFGFIGKFLLHFFVVHGISNVVSVRVKE